MVIIVFDFLRRWVKPLKPELAYAPPRANRVTSPFDSFVAFCSLAKPLSWIWPISAKISYIGFFP